MSNNSSNNGHYGYGVDLKLQFKNDGTIDLAISETGDIDIVGGSGQANQDVKIQNALQQMKLVLITPAGSNLDENGNPIPYGSNLLSTIGRKLNELNNLVIKQFVISSLYTLEFIDSIKNVLLIPDTQKKDSLKTLGIYFILKDDTQVYYTEFEVSS